MILYWRTSALVVCPRNGQRYDKTTGRYRRMLLRLLTSEARAAFARKRGERAVTLRDYRTIVQDFDDAGKPFSSWMFPTFS